MNNIPKYIFIFITLLVITNCDEEFISRDFPSVLSVSGVNNPDGTIQLTGNLIPRSSIGVEELGFVWQSGADPKDNPGFKYAIPDKTIKGSYSCTINTSLKSNTQYFFRAYAISNGYSVYGELKSFNSTSDFQLPELHLSPETGQVGDTVILTGGKFNLDSLRNIIKFEDIEAQIVSICDSSISCLVPITLTAAESTISISSDGVSGVVVEKFRLTKPVISGFSPSVASMGDTVEIYGTGFHRTDGLNTVLIGDFAAEVLESTHTLLTVINPPYSDSLCSITVTVSGQFAVSTGKLKVRVPDFYEFTPESANYLETVTIKYKSVGPGSIHSVWFDTFEAQILSITGSEILVRVPVDLNKSLSHIKINFGTTSYTFGNAFILKQPYLTSISETMVTNNSLVEVYGVGFSSNPSLNKLALKNIETGNEYYLTPAVASATSFRVTVYNHLTGTQLPSGAYITGIKSTGTIIWSEQILTITDMWRRLADFPGGARYKCAAFAINGKGYTGLGTKLGNDIQKDLWEYSPVSENWTRRSDFPGNPRILPCVFVNSTSAYVGGGQSLDNSTSQVPFKDFYRYTPGTNTWAQIADAPAVEKSYPGGSSSPSDNIHVANISTSIITEYNSENDQWSETYNGLAATNRSPQTFSINGKVYFVGGINNTLTNGTNNQVWKYDPDANTMTRKNDFPGDSRYGGFSFSIGNYGYIGCGVNATYSPLIVNYLTDVYRYDPVTDTWTKLLSYPGGSLHTPVSFIIGNKAYILTGYNQVSLLNTVYEFYDPENASR